MWIPEDVEVSTASGRFAGGVYKAVQECRGIFDEVKAIAAEKCEAIVMAPTMYKTAARRG